jgi:hypothetical protein
MPRQKKTSNVLEKAEQRLFGFRTIDPNLTFGDTLSINELSLLTTQLRNQLNQYNMLLTELDTARVDMATLEKTVNEISERLMNGVAFKYGKDSREYEISGGVRKSTRARKASITRLKSNSDPANLPSETA